MAHRKMKSSRKESENGSLLARFAKTIVAVMLLFTALNVVVIFAITNALTN